MTVVSSPQPSTPWREFHAASASQRWGATAIAFIFAALLTFDLGSAFRAGEVQRAEHGAHYCYTVAHKSACR